MREEQRERWKRNETKWDAHRMLTTLYQHFPEHKPNDSCLVRAETQ